MIALASPPAEPNCSLTKWFSSASLYCPRMGRGAKDTNNIKLRIQGPGIFRPPEQNPFGTLASGGFLSSHLKRKSLIFFARDKISSGCIIGRRRVGQCEQMDGIKHELEQIIIRHKNDI